MTYIIILGVFATVTLFYLQEEIKNFFTGGENPPTDDEETDA